jgi:5-methyltetrahydrofolate--homocysteine methyltransferase
MLTYMMGKIVETIQKGKVLVSDGAWGTFLHQKGLTSDECPESWNLTRPDDVKDVASSYVKAGAGVILTNSFGGNPFKLESYGLKDRTFEINLAAARISREAAGKEVLVLGSMGPTGKMILMGEVSEEELLAGFREQARGLSEGGVDGLLVETMSDVQESVMAIQAAKSVSELDVLCTFTFERTKQGDFRTMMGTGVKEAMESVLNAGADVIGANCGNGTAGMIEIVKEIRSFDPNVPVLVHANAGLPEYHEGKTIFPEAPHEMACQMQDLVKAGANIVGGCCGTTPEHIREIVKVVNG